MTKNISSISNEELSKESWKFMVFLGIVFFFVGILIWFSKAGIISEEMLLPTIFMGIGVLCIFKGAMMIKK